MKKIFFTFIFLLIAHNISAQYAIKGKVTDKTTGEALTGVTVYIPQTKQGTTTDLDGIYKIDNISLKEIDIEFSYQGYKSIKRHIVFTSPLIELNIAMEEDVFELNEVIVSTPFSKLQKDNVMKVSRKTISSMEKQGIQSLMEGVSQVAGVSQLSTGTGISKPVIRGLTGNRVLVYNQNTRVENFQFGEEHGMGIDDSGIEAIEVIKGPASLLYGSDALGGVLYLVPEKYAPKNKQTADAQFKYFSNTKGYAVNSGYKKSFERWKFLIRGSIKRNGDYAIPGGLYAENSANELQDFKWGTAYKAGRISSDFRYNYNHQKNGLPHRISTEFHFSPSGKYQDLTNHRLSLKNDFHFEKSSIQTTLGYTSHKRAVIINNNPKIGMHLQTWEMDAKWYLPQKIAFESIIGMQAMYQTNTNYGEHFLLPDATIANGGVFGTINYTRNETVVQGGLRFDSRYISTKDIGSISSADYRPGFDKNLYSFSGSLGIKQNFNSHFIGRLNIASGFRAPNLAELSSAGLHESRVEIGNPDLKNEQNLQTDFNLSYENIHIEFFANAFYNKINNYIFLQPTGEFQEGFPVYKYTQDDAYLYGGEAGLHFHPHPLDWLHFDSSYETVIGKRADGRYLPLLPADQWKNTLRLSRKLQKKNIQEYYWYTSVNHSFEASRISDFEDPHPAYTLINSGIGIYGKTRKFSFETNLSVHNLTDKKYISHLSVLREDGIPNPGRNIILSLKIKI